MMDAQRQFPSHDRKLVSIFEIVGSHFVDIYFNHVWASAQANLGAGASITDEYTRRVQAYITGVKTDERCYREVITGLHNYFRATTRYTALSFADFVERIVSQCIPEEYHDLLKAPEKDETLGSVVADLVSGLGAYVTTPDLLRRIIDEHDRQPEVTIRMIQDQGIVILLAKRGEIYNKFLRRVGQAKETVSMDIVEDLKKAIRKLVKQKAGLQAALGEAEERAMELEDALAAAKTREAKYKKLVRLLGEERESGVVSAAFGARVPPGNRHAEGPHEDPLDFGRAKGGRKTPREPRPIPPDRLAERDREDPVSASFFAEASAPPEAVGGRAPAQGPSRRTPGGAPSGGRPPPAARRLADLSSLMAPAEEGDDDDDDEDETGSPESDSETSSS